MTWKILDGLLGKGATLPSTASKTKSPNTKQQPKAYIIREGKTVPVDEAFEAWTSGNLSRMLRALSVKTNPIDRHFLLMGIVEQSYRRRSDPEMARTCSRVAELHIAEFSSIAPALERDMGGILPHVTTFQHYATLLSEQREFDKAIEVCTKALALGLHDGTQSGFEGRIERIKKQKAKNRHA
jgi:hypothetical protein